MPIDCRAARADLTAARHGGSTATADGPSSTARARWRHLSRAPAQHVRAPPPSPAPAAARAARERAPWPRAGTALAGRRAAHGRALGPCAGARSSASRAGHRAHATRPRAARASRSPRTTPQRTLDPRLRAGRGPRPASRSPRRHRRTMPGTLTLRFHDGTLPARRGAGEPSMTERELRVARWPESRRSSAGSTRARRGCARRSSSSRRDATLVDYCASELEAVESRPRGAPARRARGAARGPAKDEAR